MEQGKFANSRTLSNFIFRRDRLRLAVWLLAITLVNVMVVVAYTELYQNAAERQAMAETMRNPAMISMLGPGYGLDDYTIGAMIGHQMLLFTALAVAIMNILFVTRHTRADEEGGRIELIRSLPVGRLANLASTLTVSLIANLLLVFIAGFGLYACGVESVDLSGSLLYGALLGVTGLLFASITALCAQLAESSRGSLGYSFAILGLFYLLRAVGDVGSEFLALLSPLGIILRSQVYVNNLWWPIPLTLVLSSVFWVGAFYLNSQRDMGAGLIRPRPGREVASRLLQGPLGLAYRLQFTSIIAWLIGLFILGLSYGSVFGDLETFLESNDFLKDILPVTLGFSLTEQFLAMLMSVLSMLATIPALLIVLKLRTEESEGRLEHLLSRVVSRSQVLRSFVWLSSGVGSLSMLLSGLGVWLAANAVMEQPIEVVVGLQASLGQLPAILGMLALTVFLIGWWPKQTGAIWLYLGYSFFTVYFGVLLKLPSWMSSLSPFGLMAQMPVEPFNPVNTFLLVSVSLIVLTLGIVGFGKRDLLMQ